MLRNNLLEISRVVASKNVSKEKAQLMFDYLTSNEFHSLIENMLSPIIAQKDELEKEKRAFKKVWAAREKLIEQTIDAADNFWGSLKGIAGGSLNTLNINDELDNLVINNTKEKKLGNNSNDK